MMKKILALTLALCLAGGTFTTVFADEVQTTTESGVTATAQVTNETAGILPDSPFYNLEREVEKLQLAITNSQERLAALEAAFAAERAAEAIIMTESDEDELAEQATKESMGLFVSSAKHLNKAIEAKDDAIKTMELLNDSYLKSQQLLETILLKAPEESKEAIQTTLDEQDETITAINGFYAAKAAFFDAKDELKQRKEELKLAREAGSPEAIQIALDKVREAEALKDELEELKDSAEVAKEEVKNLTEQVNKNIEKGLKHLDKADQKMDQIVEKNAKINKIEEKKIEKEEKKQLKSDEKEKKEAMKEIKKAREEAKESEKNINEN